MANVRPHVNGSPFTPVLVLELNLDDPLQAIPGPTPERPHRTARILVRLHGDPLGGLELAIPTSGFTCEALAAAVWSQLGSAICRHLAQDGLPQPLRLDPAGISTNGKPACEIDRDRFLHDAPRIAVLIPSHERPERLRRCVESILACEFPADRLQVVVADNAPKTDGTRAVVSELSRLTDARVIYVREDASGSASARNRGLTVIDAPLVAMTDDDVTVDRNWLTEIGRTFQANPGAGAVSGLLWPAELETPAQVWFEQYGGFSRGFQQRIFDLGPNRPSDEPLYPWNAGLFGTGNNFSFRTDVLRRVGGFDPALGNGTPALGGVDSEVLLRLILSGHQVVYQPRAIAHHAHRADFEGLRRQVYGYGVGLTAYYTKTVLADPTFALDFVRKLPGGLRWLVNPSTHINKFKCEDYPSELTWLERRGMIYGPIAYARSRRRYGRHPVYRHAPNGRGPTSLRAQPAIDDAAVRSEK